MFDFIGFEVLASEHCRLVTSLKNNPLFIHISKTKVKEEIRKSYLDLRASHKKDHNNQFSEWESIGRLFSLAINQISVDEWEINNLDSEKFNSELITQSRLLEVIEKKLEEIYGVKTYVRDSDIAYVKDGIILLTFPIKIAESALTHKS